MIRFRAFRNGDPPALAELWNRGLPDREVVRPLSPHEFNEMILTRLHFDAKGLILAEDDGRLVGFVHAAFGPEAAAGPSHQIDRTMGTVAMLVVDHDRDDPSLELSLFAQAEAYLESRQAKVIYAGGQNELSSYYWGVYGGSECSGVLDTHQAFRRGSEASGYQPVAKTIHFELDLSAPEVRDPRSLLIRRQTRLETIEDAMPANWWESSSIGCSQICRFRLLARDNERVLATASTWDMAAFGRLDGKARTGLIDVEVAAGERRKGYGRFLVGEILRHSRNSGPNTSRSRPERPTRRPSASIKRSASSPSIPRPSTAGPVPARVDLSAPG